MTYPDAAVLLSLGKQVHERRKALRWTRRELGERSGISERFLADVERGRANPSLLRICQLADALDCSPIDLLAETGEDGAGNVQIIALIGLRGAGKSAVGTALAQRLGCSFIELDHRIEEDAGIALHQIFALHGESFYRRSELRILRELLRRPGKSLVLATGGGLVTANEAFSFLRDHSHTIWLRASPEEHWSRVVSQGDLRPMAEGDKAFATLCEILAEREPFYRQAQTTVETSGRAIDEIAGELAHQLQEV